MQFGHYEDKNREYVIERPDTPYPWINYLGTEDFTGIISNTGGGYSYLKDARLRRITRYRYNDQPADSVGRFFYILDRETGDLWNPGWAPRRMSLDHYACRHGLGYSIITGIKNGIEAELAFLCPIGESCEIHRVIIRNHNPAAKRISLWSYAEFCLWNAYDDMTNFQRNWSTGEVQVESEGSHIMHVTEYRERRNHFAFYSSSRKPDGFDTDRRVFCGAYGSLASPEKPLQGSSGNSIAHGWAPIASHRHDMEISPGSEICCIFVLGYVEQTPEKKWDARGLVNPAPMFAMTARYPDSHSVDTELRRLSEYWDSMLGNFSINSGIAELDRSLNIWNQYQCFTTFRVSRSASSFESGIGRGIGFRDTNQDIAGIVHMMPERARERILDVAATQLRDGGAFHQYQPLTKLGNHDIGSDFNDDPLWLIYSTASYIKETGDFSILKEQIPFENKPELAAELLEHLKRGFFKAVRNTGEHGLPLIGRADWNDCLNLNCFSMTPDESFQTTTNQDGSRAESVMIAGLALLMARELAVLAEHEGDTTCASEALSEAERLAKALNEHAWDGHWWLRAFDAKGNPVGSASCAEGRIFIEPQGFLAWSRVGHDRNRPLLALDAVAEHLETPRGLMLVHPAYSRYNPALGEITSYPPGYKENAGIFCHNNPWVIIAEAVNGRYERAFRLFTAICPAFLGEKSGEHRMEPYVYSQMIAGRNAATFGEAKNSWLTGTAAWAFVAASQWIAGIRPEYEGLAIDPRLPPSIPGFSVKRTYRNAVYDISFDNSETNGKIILEVDGTMIEGCLVPAFNDGRVHRVHARRSGDKA